MAASVFCFFLSCFLSVIISALLLSCAEITPVAELYSINLIACVAVYFYFIVSLHKKLDVFIKGYFKNK